LSAGSGCIDTISGRSTFRGSLQFSSGGAFGTYDVSSGQISAVNLNGGGAGYTTPPSLVGFNCTTLPNIIVTLGGGRGCISSSGTLSFVGGGGFGASGRYTASGGVIYSVEITSGGRSYVSAPSIVTSDGACSSYSIIASLDRDSISGVGRRVISITKASTSNSSVTVGFDNPFLDIASEVTTYDLIPPDGSSESRANGFVGTPENNSATQMNLDFHVSPNSQIYRGAQVQLSSSIQSITLTFSVSSVLLVNGGAGCSASSGVLKFTGGGGSGAAGTFQVVGGVVTNVILIDGGS